MLFNSSPGVFRPDWPELPDQFGSLSTLRTGGVSLAPFDDGSGSGAGGFNLGDHVGDSHHHVAANRSYLAELVPNKPQWLTQVHGAAVVQLNSEPQNYPIADASFTNQSGVVCAVLTADCLPVLLCDPKNGVVAAVHAGWRSLVGGVLEQTVSKMQQLGAQPDQLLAWLGPAIGPLNFEVGAEVREQFISADPLADHAFQQNRFSPEKFDANIYLLAQQRLSQIGIHQISGGSFCTVRQAEYFYSYRRDGVTGRMASLIWVK